jgi:hypothetical protein
LANSPVLVKKSKQIKLKEKTKTPEVKDKVPKERIPYVDRPIQEDQIPYYEHPTTFEFWDLYMEAKLARKAPKEHLEQENQIQQSNSEDQYGKRKYPTLNKKFGARQNTLNQIANVISGAAIYIAIAGKHELRIKDMVWEYHVPFADELGYDSKMNQLILEASSFENLPKYLVSEINKYTAIDFYKKYDYLLGTTLSLRLDNQTQEGYYFCIPFRALNYSTLRRYLEVCTVEKPNFDHGMIDYSTRFTVEELRQKASKYFKIAALAVECDHLDFC